MPLHPSRSRRSRGRRWRRRSSIRCLFRPDRETAARESFRRRRPGPWSMTREVLVVAHPRRPLVRDSAQRVLDLFSEAGIRPRILGQEAGELDLTCADVVDAHDRSGASGVELVLVLGGDGSLLRGADLARSANAPLLGVSLGHVGFLAEAESEALDSTVAAIVARDYTVEERMTLDVTVRNRKEVIGHNWALNEMSLEK